MNDISLQKSVDAEVEMTQEQVVNVATTICYNMLKSGAEIYRVEQSARYISNAYGFIEMDCTAILTSLFVTVMDGDKICTRTKRVVGRDTNLGKVSALNDLSRYICEVKPDYETVMDSIHKIEQMPAHRFYWKLTMPMLAAGSFALLFGGNLTESLIAAIVAAVVYPILWVGSKIDSNTFFSNIVTSAVITLLLCGVRKWIYDGRMDIVIISVLMNLVPGVAITHCMRDLMSNEVLSGLARLAETLICALGIAIGVLSVFSVVGITF